MRRTSLAIAGLGKHRRRFPGGAEVDLVAGEGVEELRSGRKLTPQHVDAEAGEGGFQTLTGFQDPEAAGSAGSQCAVRDRPRLRWRMPAAAQAGGGGFDQPEVSELGAQGMPADPNSAAAWLWLSSQCAMAWRIRALVTRCHSGSPGSASWWRIKSSSSRSLAGAGASLSVARRSWAGLISSSLLRSTALCRVFSSSRILPGHE